MTDERWGEVSNMIQNNMQVEEHQTAPMDGEPGTVEWFVFTSPLGRLRLERYIRPRVTGSHMIISKRAGSGGREEKEYSNSETVSFIKVWKWVNENWQEVDEQVLGI